MIQPLGDEIECGLKANFVIDFNNENIKYKESNTFWEILYKTGDRKLILEAKDEYFIIHNYYLFSYISEYSQHSIEFYWLTDYFSDFKIIAYCIEEEKKIIIDQSNYFTVIGNIIFYFKIYINIKILY